jgi:hypothetical protein
MLHLTGWGIHLTSRNPLFTLTNSHLINFEVLLGQVAQLVEQRTENPRVGGSTPSLATIRTNDLGRAIAAFFLFGNHLGGT